MLTAIAGAAIAILVIVALEDYRESSRDHTYEDIFPDTGYWSNRWQAKYRADGSRKWYYYGLGASVIDAWHLAKTIGVIVITGHILAAWGILYWWSLLAAWIFYGGLHELLYNGIYKRKGDAS